MLAVISDCGQLTWLTWMPGSVWLFDGYIYYLRIAVGSREYPNMRNMCRFFFLAAMVALVMLQSYMSLSTTAHIDPASFDHRHYDAMQSLGNSLLRL